MGRCSAKTRSPKTHTATLSRLSFYLYTVFIYSIFLAMNPATLSHSSDFLGSATPVAERLCLPLSSVSIQAGFPSPAADYSTRALDLNELLIEQPESTFFWRVRGPSMSGAGILEGSILVVDRALPARHGMIVVAALDGEFTVKRLYQRGSDVRLQAAHPDYPELRPKPEQEWQIWGVVRASILPLLQARPRP